MEPDLMDVLRRWIICVTKGGHRFLYGICTTCGAKEGGPTLGELAVQHQRPSQALLEDLREIVKAENQRRRGQ